MSAVTSISEILMRVADGLGYGIGGLGNLNAAGYKGRLYRAQLLVGREGGHAGRRLSRLVLGRKLIMSPTLDSALESVLWQKRVKSQRRMGRRDTYVRTYGGDRNLRCNRLFCRIF